MLRMTSIHVSSRNTIKSRKVVLDHADWTALVQGQLYVLGHADQKLSDLKHLDNKVGINLCPVRGVYVHHPPQETAGCARIRLLLVV